MQVQYESGEYGEPKKLDTGEVILSQLDKRIRRILVFARYDENGKSSAEMRRAWRRRNRTKWR